MSLRITDADLDDWSRRRDSEGHLPTLVRRLIMASVRPDWIRMPAAEGVALSGLDGVVTVSGLSHPYVPTGDSVWELGTNEKRKAKATADYDKRTAETPPEVRERTTYVCVLSRKWGSGEKWIKEMQKLEHGWKDIVVLAADELALWLESCPGVEAWLREHLGKGSLGDTAIEDWFGRWSRQTQPATPAALLTAGRRKDVIRLLDALDAPPTQDAIPVATASLDEAIAFTAAALHLGPEPQPPDPEQSQHDGESPEPDPGIRAPEHLEALRARTIVITDESGWRRWSTDASPHILIPVFVPDSIDEAVAAGHHVVLPRAARDAHETGRLLPLDPHAAAAAWRTMGVDFYKAHEYALASRRNLGTMRRRLNRYGRQTPAWASGTEAALLASALLAGAWDESKEGDREVLLALTRHDNSADLTKTFAPLSIGEDPPLGRLGHVWDFVDVVDAWDAIGTLVTRDDLAVFNDAVTRVLVEADPEAQLTSEELLKLAFDPDRPRSRYSHSLRRGLTTSLAVLGAVVGDKVAAGAETGETVATLAVRSLLRDADGQRWVILARELQLLAEAAPEAFLDAVEASVSDEAHPILALFNERADLLSTRSSHSSLLWALETLAFSPKYVARAAVALGQLAELDPGGKLSNRPSASLISVLNLVRPDGAIEASTRLDVLDAVITAAPDHSIDLLKGLIENRGGGLIASGPRYRDWPTPRLRSSSGEYQAALSEICKRLLSAPASRLPDVAGLVGRFSPADLARILDMFAARWPELEGPAQEEILGIVAKEAGRHRRFSDAAWAMPAEALESIDQFLASHGYDLDEGKDEALFTWDADLDEHRQTGRSQEGDQGEVGGPTLSQKRATVVAALLESGGLPRVLTFAANVEVPTYVGKALADLVTDGDAGPENDILDLLGDGQTSPVQPGADVAWTYASQRAGDFGWLSRQVTQRPTQAAVLLGTVRISSDVLEIAAGLELPQQTLFWARVNPYRLEGDVVDAVCEGLLEARRPFSAMVAASVREEPGPSAELIIRVLSADHEDIAETPLNDYHSLSYTVGLLLDRLEALDADDATLARLEFSYLPVLDDRDARALHRELARKPELFASAVSNVYKTDTEPATDVAAALAGTETSGMTDEQFRFSDASWRLLIGWHDPLPGSTIAGEPPTTEALQTWVDQVREELTRLDRARIASAVIGDALAGTATDPDGTWPCEAVRNAIEHEASDDLDAEFRVNRRNQRGLHTRSVYAGGDQERDLAAEYRKHADSVRNRWPRTGATLDILARSYDEDGRREDGDAEGDARGHR